MLNWLVCSLRISNYRNKVVQFLITFYVEEYHWNLSIRYKIQIKYNDLVLKLCCCLRYHIRMSLLQKSNKKPHKRESIKSFHIAYCLMAYSIITYYTICSFHAQDYDFLAFYIILVVQLLRILSIIGLVAYPTRISFGYY